MTDAAFSKLPVIVLAGDGIHGRGLLGVHVDRISSVRIACVAIARRLQCAEFALDDGRRIRVSDLHHSRVALAGKLDPILAATGLRGGIAGIKPGDAPAAMDVIDLPISATARWQQWAGIVIASGIGLAFFVVGFKRIATRFSRKMLWSL